MGHCAGLGVAIQPWIIIHMNTLLNGRTACALLPLRVKDFDFVHFFRCDGIVYYCLYSCFRYVIRTGSFPVTILVSRLTIMILGQDRFFFKASSVSAMPICGICWTWQDVCVTCFAYRCDRRGAPTVYLSSTVDQGRLEAARPALPCLQYYGISGRNRLLAVRSSGG